MAKIDVPNYFKSRQTGAEPTRYYWAPGPGLRRRGWRTTVLSTDLVEAIGQAKALNERAEAHRLGKQDSGPAGAREAVGAPDPRGGRPNPYIQPGTLDALIAAYKQSRFWTELKESTRKRYADDLKVLTKWAGDRDPAALGPADVETLYESFRHTHPRKARGLVVTLGRLYTAGKKIGAVTKDTHNPAERPGIKYRPKRTVIWPAEAVDHFVKTADGEGLHALGTAVILNAWLGQRKMDLIGLPRRMFRNGAFYIEQSKTGALVTLPVDAVPKLAARLEAELARQRDRGIEGTTLLLCEATGRPYAKSTFDRDFAAVRARAAETMPTVPLAQNPTETVPFKDLWFMRLRHTAVVRLAEAGNTSLQIASVTGHDPDNVDSILKHYWVPTPEQAESAFKARLEHEGE